EFFLICIPPFLVIVYHVQLFFQSIFCASSQMFNSHIFTNFMTFLIELFIVTSADLPQPFQPITSIAQNADTSRRIELPRCRRHSVHRHADLLLFSSSRCSDKRNPKSTRYLTLEPFNASLYRPFWSIQSHDGLMLFCQTDHLFGHPIQTCRPDAKFLMKPYRNTPAGYLGCIVFFLAEFLFKIHFDPPRPQVFRFGAARRS